MCTNSGWVSLSVGSPSWGGRWYTTQREEYRQPTNDIRLEKYITPWAPPTSEVRGPIATETRIWARKYWQLSREMSTPIPRLVPSSDEPQNCGTHMRKLSYGAKSNHTVKASLFYYFWEWCLIVCYESYIGGLIPLLYHLNMKQPSAVD